jgi:hypothetical protein
MCCDDFSDPIIDVWISARLGSSQPATMEVSHV